ncbi:alpha/beta hydrolase family protein [Tellurirhabdus rosea]|uniref:alpha/beta hydrolase family protein n=1 Tax=Tellurirhabdus rosea TaxID=2674997 RepID=UPI00225B33C1|nr:dienelactone hydrolase [Tellurirhabdus rosea]
MQRRFLYFFLLLLITILGPSDVRAQTDTFVVGDPLPDAPELAARGPYKVGVRTIQFVHSGQKDILKAKDGNVPTYDRKLTVEVWYPAQIPAGKTELTQYEQVMGLANNPSRPLVPYTFPGRALRDAEPDTREAAYPLVIVSHGYPGSRYLMTYLTENLASKGYVVVAIDHAESTYRDVANFASTLLNRPLDDLFVLDEMARLSAKNSKSFLSGLLNANNTALIGYSMGGYGALNVGGAGYSPQAVAFFGQMAGGSDALKVRAAGSPALTAAPDARIKAIVAFAPWGMERGVWDAEGLKGLRLPTLFIAGDKDDVSGYEKGIKAIYDGAVNADRYLLTYVNARHNVAPNAPAAAVMKPGLPINEYMHYAEPGWNERRINNINQHFVTAYIGLHLKGQDNRKYLDVPESITAGQWPGFKPRAVGLEMRHNEGQLRVKN